MILAIDIGNSKMEVGCLEGNDILFKEQLHVDPLATDTEYAIQIKMILEVHGVTELPEGGIISCVVPPLTEVMRRAVKKTIGDKKILVLGPGIKTGLDIKIDNPASMGSGLVAGIAGALPIYGAPLAVVDMGTAVSITVVNEKRQVIGGTIHPGISISVDALAAGTSQLPRIAVEKPKHVIGKNTVDAMKSGTLFGAAAALDGLLNMIEEELGYPLTVVATGGQASPIIPFCKRNIPIDEALRLKGLKNVYDRN